MTTNFHTPLSGIDDVSAIAFNSRFSDLDSAITNVVEASTSTQISVTLGESVAANQAGYIDMSDGLGYLLDADSSVPKAGTIRGFWTTTASSGATGTLQINGLLSGFSGLTARQPVYVGTSAGSLTQTRPSPTSGGAQVAIMQMGVAISATEVYVNPLAIQYQKRAALAENDTLTVDHHTDVNGYRRNLWAYITETVAGAAITEHGSANQDNEHVLRGPVAPDTYTADQCTGGTATASSSLSSSFLPEYGFDDDTATAWASNGTGGSPWLEYEFSSAKTIRQYAVTAYEGPTTGAIRDWTLQYYDGAAWQTADTRTSQTGWSEGERRTFDVSGVHSSTRWRIAPTANNGGSNHIIGELEMMEVATYEAAVDNLAQTFTLSGTEDIGSVSLYMKKVGSPAGTVTVRIETTSGGEPTGTLADAAASVTFAESELTTSFADTLLTFASSFELTSGVYAIVVSTTRSQSDDDYIAWGSDSGASYGDGTMFAEVSSAYSDLSEDAIFGVFAPGTVHPSRLSVDWWSSTHADMVNRYGDGSGANLNDQTTFKCVRAAGFDDVTVVVEIP